MVKLDNEKLMKSSTFSTAWIHFHENNARQQKTIWYDIDKRERNEEKHIPFVYSFILNFSIVITISFVDLLLLHMLMLD